MVRARCLVSTADPSRFVENLGAIDVDLTSGDLQHIEQATTKIRIHGARVPERLQSQLGR